jgi:dipeptidyl aminopeptidase/acylaminoacyl peptidase
MKRTSSLVITLVLLFTLACTTLIPGMGVTATPDISLAATLTAAAGPSPTPFNEPVTATTTLDPHPIPPEGTATPPGQPSSPVPGQQFLAYVRDGQLLVSDVTNGVVGGTTQYTLVDEGFEVSDPVWSPSGEFVAFVSSVQGDPHIFSIFALGQISPTDLGPGSAPAWSPDSQSIAYIGGDFGNENIWVTTLENPAPRQLTFETNFAWARPVFTPDGESLIVAGTSRDNMGASGNTNFTLEYLELDGSGTRTPIPGTLYEGGRLPYDMQFSPDGTRLAFSTSYHWSACASPGAYYVLDAQSPALQELVSPSLQNVIDPNAERFHVGLSYDWAANDALVGLGNVIDCKIDSPTSGQVIGGPQMSILGLDGSERTVIPGFFYGISVDRTGTLIAAARYLEGFADTNPTLEIYSAQTGQVVASVGPGREPKFQP